MSIESDVADAAVQTVMKPLEVLARLGGEGLLKLMMFLFAALRGNDKEAAEIASAILEGGSPKVAKIRTADLSVISEKLNDADVRFLSSKDGAETMIVFGEKDLPAVNKTLESLGYGMTSADKKKENASDKESKTRSDADDEPVGRTANEKSGRTQGKERKKPVRDRIRDAERKVAERAAVANPPARDTPAIKTPER